LTIYLLKILRWFAPVENGYPTDTAKWRSNKMNSRAISSKFTFFVPIIILLYIFNFPSTVFARTGGELPSIRLEVGKGPQADETNPVPVIQSLTPDQVKSSGPDFLLQIQGQGFVTDTLVSWNSIAKPTTYISSTLITATIFSSDITTPDDVDVFVNNPPPGGGDSNKLVFKIMPNSIYAPIIFNYFPPYPFIPSLSPIDNSSLNNIYSVNWDSARFAEAYRLQEATDPGFSNAIDIYDDISSSWSTPYPGKAPGTYYYRVQSYNVFGKSSWSSSQAVTVYPPPTPTLYGIDNTDQNNIYTVLWNSSKYATAYRLQEATDISFTNITQVYEGTDLTWTTPNPGKVPGPYYYRVQSYNSFGPSSWSTPNSVTVYPLTVPTIYPIDNSYQDNKYYVAWINVKYATAYRLQEATDPGFVNMTQIYDGAALFWFIPDPGKLPGTYYYRVQSYNNLGSSSWSETQKLTIYPLFVGLKLGWDGNGYIRGSEYYDIGTHETDNLDALTESDTIRFNGHAWYDPDPIGFGADDWTSYYSVVTGLWKGSSSPGDPSWKWGYPWFLSYTLQLSNNKTISLDNQPFTVTGPFVGTTSWGHSIQYWQFVNQKKFLLWSDGGDWTQYIYAGEAIFRFDAGTSRLLLYSNVKRHIYYKGKFQQDTIQYIDNLSYSTSIPGSPISSNMPEPAPSGQDTIIQSPSYPFESIEPSRR
jgi:hypothetical protein